MNESKTLNNYKKNYYSQYGEDGIIEEVLSRIPNLGKMAVEFGAWDGLYLSNTYNLAEKHDFKNVLIEANPKKYNDLCETYPFAGVYINEFVGWDAHDNLESILERNNIDFSKIDLLSIDIDGNDYHIFDSLTRLRPKIICIEYNPSIPNDYVYIQKRIPGLNHACSIRAIHELGVAKDYFVVGVTDGNIVLVDCKYRELFDVSADLNDFRDDTDSKVYAFSLFDGSIELSKPINIFSHRVAVQNEDIQFFPRYLRQFPSNFSFFKRSIYYAFIILKRPRKSFSYILEKLRK